MELLCVASLKGIGIPVIATRADAYDATLTIVWQIFPCNNSTIASYAKDFSASASFPSIMVVVSAPISTNMVLSRRISDMITRIGGVDSIWIIARYKALP